MATYSWPTPTEYLPGTVWIYQTTGNGWFVAMMLPDGDWKRWRAKNKAEAWQIAVDNGLKLA